MNEFTINQIADEITLELGLNLPKSVVRKLISHHFKYMFKVMKTKRDRISMRDNEIHTIYKEADQVEIAGKVADVDETRIPTKEKDFAVRGPGWKNPMRSQKKFSKRVKYYKIPDINA